MAELYEAAKKARKRIMDQVLAEGTCPSRSELAKDQGLSDDEVGQVLKDLEAAICVAVQNPAHARLDNFQDEKLKGSLPEVGEIFYARPFASFPNHYPVAVDGEQKWFGECAVECCGISGMFPGQEVVVSSICRETKEPVEITAKDGVLLDYQPRTLRVQVGIPARFMPDDAVGWCDYNSFFSSEDAATEWRRSHPEIQGVTRDPESMARFVGLIGKGRLDYDYQFTLPLLKVFFQGKKFGFTKPVSWLGGLHLPDPFWMPTPHTLLEARRRGYGYYIKLSLL